MNIYHPGQPLLEVRGLCVDYGVGPDAVHAVVHADLVLHRGEVLGLAGESGSGKSTLAYGATRLTFTASASWSTPRLSRARAADLLAMVGINADRLGSYPHELSGGMRQRVMIAMALALEPQVVIMDEPTTALDVVTQREILEELMELRERLGFAVLFITHDLSLLVEIADSIAVMPSGACTGHRTVPCSAAPVHAGLAQLVPAAARTASTYDRHPRLTPRPAAASLRVRLPPALLLRDGPVPDGNARAAAAARGGAGRRVLAAGRVGRPAARARGARAA